MFDSFLTLIRELYNLVVIMIIPTGEANMIHVAIWTPVSVGLLGLTVVTVQSIAKVSKRRRPVDTVALSTSLAGGAEQAEREGFVRRFLRQRDEERKERQREIESKARAAELRKLSAAERRNSDRLAQELALKDGKGLTRAEQRVAERIIKGKRIRGRADRAIGVSLEMRVEQYEAARKLDADLKALRAKERAAKAAAAEQARAEREAERAKQAEERRAAKAAAAEQAKAAQAAQRAAQAEEQRQAAEQARAAKRAAAEEQRAAKAAAAEQARAAQAAQRAQQAEERRAAKAAAAEQAKAERAAQRAAKRAQQAEQRQAAKVAQRGRDPTLTTAYGNDPRRAYRFVYRIVDLDDLVTSNTDTGGINPDYDPTLQPRERSRSASQQQIDTVARQLVPEAFLTDFRTLDRGAPIIGSDRQIESGNGRILALRRARQQYSEQFESYRAALNERAEELGLSLDGVANPVLVRERLDEVDRGAFAREANGPPVLQLSTLERATVESSFINQTLIDRLQVSEVQTIDQALRSRRNSDFVAGFVGQLADNERGTILRRDGTLNSDGIRRIKSALFVATFPAESGRRLAETFLESLDSNIKNFENALSASLPQLARAQSLIDSGSRSSDLNLIDDISKSIDVLARLREDGTLTPSLYVDQSSFFEKETTPEQDRLLLYFDSLRSQKQIRDFLTSYSRAVADAPDPNQLDLFGEPVRFSKQQLLDKLIGVNNATSTAQEKRQAA